MALEDTAAPVWRVQPQQQQQQGPADDVDDGQADELEPPATGDEGAPADEGDPAGADELGDAGKAALDSMKAKWHAARDQLKPWRELAREFDLTPEQARELLEQRTKGAEEPDAVDADKVRREARAEALKAANDRIVRSEVRAAAAGKLTDPADALVYLDLDSFEVDDDGNIDEDAVADAIADLIKRKPYLAAQGGKRFQGNADTGPRNGGKASQLTQAELDRMGPAEVVAAMAEGRLDELLGRK